MCWRPKCIEDKKKAAALKEGRGPTSVKDTATQPKESAQNKNQYINASGGVTVSSKYKKGIIQ